MRKLNCKEVNEALKKEIMDSYESAEEYYTYDGAEMKTDILDETETEKQKYNNSKAERTSCLILYRELNKHAQKAN